MESSGVAGPPFSQDPVPSFRRAPTELSNDELQLAMRLTRIVKRTTLEAMSVIDRKSGEELSRLEKVHVIRFWLFSLRLHHLPIIGAVICKYLPEVPRRKPPFHDSFTRSTMCEALELMKVVRDLIMEAVDQCQALPEEAQDRGLLMILLNCQDWFFTDEFKAAVSQLEGFVAKCEEAVCEEERKGRDNDEVQEQGK